MASRASSQPSITGRARQTAARRVIVALQGRSQAPPRPQPGACTCGGQCPSCHGGVVSLQGGQRLSDPLRQRMQQHLGSPLGQVRLHDGPEAQASVQALGARAATLGQHILWGAGAPRWGSSAAQGLLAHELAHTVQQSGTGPTAPRATGEQQAQAAGQALHAGRHGAPQAAQPTGLQRDEDPAAPLSLRMRGLDLMPRMRFAPAPERGRYTVLHTNRVSDDERILTLNDGRRIRVRRQHFAEIETDGPARSPFIRPDAGAGLRELWFTVDWCQGASEGTVRVSADVPEQLLRTVAGTVLSGGDIESALRERSVTPQLGATISIGTVQVSLNAQASVDIEGNVSGVRGSVGTRINVPGGTLDLSVEGRSLERGGDAPGGGQITGILEFRPGERRTAPDCRRQRTRVVRRTVHQCSELVRVPERSEPGSRRERVTDEQRHDIFFDWWSSRLDTRRNAAALAELGRSLAGDWQVASVVGHASPEGSREASPGFEGNTALSQARADAVLEQLRGLCGDRGAGCLPEGLAGQAGGELYTLERQETDGSSAEVEGAAQQDFAAQQFLASDAEASRRTPDLERRLARARTPAQRAALVYPLLRRVEVRLQRQRFETVPTQTVIPAHDEEIDLAGGCPDHIIEAAFGAGPSR